MKKLFFISVLFCFALVLNAQVAGITRVSHTMGAGATYYEYTGVAADVVSSRWTVNGLSHDTLYYEILANKNGPLNCNVRVEVTRKGTADTYDIDLQGKIFANDSYAAIIESAANTASATMTDTTRFSYTGANGVARANKFYRYFRVLVNSDNAVAATDSLIITKVIFKLYER